MIGIRMELKAIPLEIPADANIIVGQSHFIKTVEDIYEAIVGSVPQMKFGVAFNEASGPCLTRVDGNDDALKALAVKNATAVGAGHIFVVMIDLSHDFLHNAHGSQVVLAEIGKLIAADAKATELIDVVGVYWRVVDREGRDVPQAEPAAQGTIAQALLANGRQNIDARTYATDVAPLAAA